MAGCGSEVSWQHFALASAFFAALTTVLGKAGVTTLNSNLATFVRVVVVLLFSAALLSVRGEWEWKALDRRNLSFLVASGLCTGLSWLCNYRALQLGKASQVAPVDKMGVLFSVVLAMAFLGETLSARAGLGVALIFVGGLLMLGG